MRLSRLSVSACAFAAFMLAGLTVGNGQAPAPQTQKPAAPSAAAATATAAARAEISSCCRTTRRSNERQPRVRIGKPDRASTSRATCSANNNTSRPHYHTMDRWVTVIKGTWWGGTGKVFRPKEMKPMPAGSVMFHPAYFIHYDGNQDGGETIVQIMGYGPVTTVQVEEDEKGNPMHAKAAKAPATRRHRRAK